MRGGSLDPAVEALGAPRWDGSADRLEVWYLTATDADGTGYWVHHEVVAPARSPEPAHALGWAAVFPPDGPPQVERFGPVPVAPWSSADPPARSWWCAVAESQFGAEMVRGSAGALAWDLTLHQGGPPLFTFPEWAWRRNTLPGAQVVPLPDVAVTGSFVVAGAVHQVDARGALARIYGHGNAQRWCWLHADLGDGAVLEIVAATARRGGLRRLPMRGFVQLRMPGESEWPQRPLLAAARFRAIHTDEGFQVVGRVGGRRMRVEVALPAERCVSLRYVDPDGATATCTNSERADAEVVLERRSAAWEVEHRWTLDATVHAEVGVRP